MADSDGYLGMYENPKDGVGEEDVDDYDGVDALEPDRESLDLDGDEVLDTTPPTGGSCSTRHRQVVGMISPLDQGRAIGRGTRGRGRLVPPAAPSGGRGRGRGGSISGQKRWSFNNWCRLVHCLAEDKDAFRQVMQGHMRHELDAGVNPWDKIAEYFNDESFQPPRHRIAGEHPDLRNANPTSVDTKMWSAGDLKSKWTSFKSTLTTWKRNFERSGQYNSDKADFAVVGIGEFVAIFLSCFVSQAWPFSLLHVCFS